MLKFCYAAMHLCHAVSDGVDGGLKLSQLEDRLSLKLSQHVTKAELV